MTTSNVKLVKLVKVNEGYYAVEGHPDLFVSKHSHYRNMMKTIHWKGVLTEYTAVLKVPGSPPVAVGPTLLDVRKRLSKYIHDCQNDTFKPRYAYGFGGDHRPVPKMKVESPRPHKFVMHLQDQDCVKAGKVDADGHCLICGVSGGVICPICGGERFHKSTCPEFLTT